MLENPRISQSQIIRWNPILLADEASKKKYMEILRRLVGMSRFKDAELRRWQMSVWQLYDAAMHDKSFYRGMYAGMMQNTQLSAFLLLDLFILTGCSATFFQHIRRTRRFQFLKKKSSMEQRNVLNDVCDCFLSSSKRKNLKSLRDFGKPLETCIAIIKKDIAFQKQQPMRILITGMMSAGKSTFINALLGRAVMPAQNLACTSKIHAIASKPYDDGFIYEDDADLVLDAGKKELFQDHPQNPQSYISIGVAFYGNLAGRRMVIYDSPGVNSSMNEAHRKVTTEFLQSGESDVVLYLMNFTQLMTEDDDAYARIVLRSLRGRKILFVINKVDEVKEGESLEEAMESVASYLENIGFRHPMVCPVSAAAAFFGKRVASGMEMNPMQQLQYGIYRQQFTASSLAGYYREHFPKRFGDEEGKTGRNLLQDSGIAYVEQLIAWLGK